MTDLFVVSQDLKRSADTNPMSIRSYMAKSDYQNVFELLTRLHPESVEMKAAFKYLKRRAHNLICHERNWALITALAESLMQRPTLSGEEVRKIFIHSFKEQLQRHRQSINVNTQVNGRLM